MESVFLDILSWGIIAIALLFIPPLFLANSSVSYKRALTGWCLLNAITVAITGCLTAIPWAYARIFF